jgi:hypothetical protein
MNYEYIIELLQIRNKIYSDLAESKKLEDIEEYIFNFEQAVKQRDLAREIENQLYTKASLEFLLSLEVGSVLFETDDLQLVVSDKSLTYPRNFRIIKKQKEEQV